MATDAELRAFLKQEAALGGGLAFDTSPSKAILGGIITGAGSVGGFVAASAFAPATGGLSFLVPLAGGIAASLATEVGKDALALVSPLFASIDRSEKAHPGAAVAGSFIPESLLIVPSIRRLGVLSLARARAGVATKTIVSDIGREVGKGVAGGAAISTGFQLGIGAVTGSGFKVDPFIVLGDAILGGLTTRAPLNRLRRADFEQHIDALRRAEPVEARATRAERDLAAAALIKNLPKENIAARSFIDLATKLEEKGTVRTTKTEVAGELRDAIKRSKHEVTFKLSKDGETVTLKKVGEFSIDDEIFDWGRSDRKMSELIKETRLAEDPKKALQKLRIALARGEFKDSVVISSAVRQKDFPDQILPNTEKWASELQSVVNQSLDAMTKTETSAFTTFRKNPNPKNLLDYIVDVTRRSKNRFLKNVSDEAKVIYDINSIMGDFYHGKAPIGSLTEAWANSRGIIAEQPKIYANEFAAQSKQIDSKFTLAVSEYAELLNLQDSFNLAERDLGRLRKAEGTTKSEKRRVEIQNEIKRLEAARPRNIKSIDDINFALRDMEQQLGTETIQQFRAFLTDFRKMVGLGTFESRVVEQITGQPNQRVKGLMQMAVDEGYVPLREAQAIIEARPNWSPASYLGWLEAGESAFQKTGKKLQVSALQFMDKDTSATELRLNFFQNTEAYMTRFIINIMTNRNKLLMLEMRGNSDLKGLEFMFQIPPKAAKAPPANSGLGEIRVREEGKWRRLWLPDEMVKAINTFEPREFNAVISVLSMPAQLVRATAVNFNPIFGFKNPVRDILNAWGKLNEFGLIADKNFNRIGLGEFVREVKDVGLKDAIPYIIGKKETKLVREGREIGTFMAGQLSELQRIAKESKKGFTFNFAAAEKQLRGPIKTIKDIAAFPTEVSELAVRLTVFRMMKGLGKSAPTAAYMSRSLMDYARQGVVGRYINAVTPFFNAPIRGMNNLLDVLGRGIKNPETEGANAVLKLSMMGLFPALYAAIAAKRIGMIDEWLHESPDVLDSQYLFPVTKIKDSLGVERPFYFRFPKPDIFRPIEAVYTNYVKEALKGNDDSAPSRILQGLIRGVKQSTPINIVDHSDSILVNMLSTVLQFGGPGVTVPTELIANQDFYRGRAIIPRRLQGLPPELQTHSWTPDLYNQLGKALNLAPLQIQHMVEGYGAGVARIAVNLFSTITPSVGLSEDLRPIVEQFDVRQDQLKASRKFQDETNKWVGRFLSSGFFMLGRGVMQTDQTRQVMRGISQTERANTNIRSTILNTAEQEFLQGREQRLLTLTVSPNAVMRKEAKKRLEEIRLGLTSAEKRLRSMTTTQRAVQIAILMLDDPLIYQNLKAKGVITPDVDAKLREIDPEAARKLSQIAPDKLSREDAELLIGLMAIRRKPKRR